MHKRHLLSLVLTGSLFSLASAATVEEKYPSGRLKLKYITDAEGRKNGYYAEYYETGKVKLLANYRADELEGPHTTYYPRGSIQVSAIYKQGRLHGAYSERDEKGQSRLSATYRNGRLHGMLRQYDKGRETFSQNFNDGEPVFPRTLMQLRAALAKIEAGPATEKKLDALATERQAALRRLKAYRYLVGVPYDNLELDEEMNRLCAAGARLCEKVGRLDHTPPNPGWPDAEYKRAYRGTSESNLALNCPTLSNSVDGYMDDSDPKNIDVLGHRRWCINPALRKTGFGKSGAYSAMYAFDTSQANVPDYDYISYPAPGFMPISYFTARTAWSLTLNPKKYLAPTSAIKVRLYELDERMNRVGEALKLDHSKVDTTKVGIANCIGFRPVQLKLKDGQSYLVEFDGIESPQGIPARLRFLVVFVDLKPDDA